jgi:hypothetical protein
VLYKAQPKHQASFCTCVHARFGQQSCDRKPLTQPCVVMAAQAQKQRWRAAWWLGDWVDVRVRLRVEGVRVRGRRLAALRWKLSTVWGDGWARGVDNVLFGCNAAVLVAL